MNHNPEPVVTNDDPKYRDISLIDWAGNPFAECLPPFQLNQTAIFKKLLVLPEWKEEDLKRSEGERYLMVPRIRHFMYPGQAQIDLDIRINELLWNGYRFRNPLTPLGQRLLYTNLDGEWQLPNHAHAPIMLLRGPSGVGKTASYKATVRNLGPKQANIIRHHSYKGAAFNETQILSILIEMRRADDRSSKGLMKEIGNEFQRLVFDPDNTSVFLYKDATEPDLREAAIKLLRAYNVGLLIIDDLQFLLEKPGQLQSSVISFLVSVTTKVGIPVLLIGTENVLKLFTGSSTIQSRLSEGGYLRIERPLAPNRTKAGKRTDPAQFWGAFTEALLQSRWTKKPWKPLNSDFLRAFDDRTQRIARFAVNLAMAMQQDAIRGGGEEIIDIKRLDKVFKRDMYIVHPIVDALRSTEPDALSGYEEMYYEYEEYLAGLDPEVQKTKEEVVGELLDEKLASVLGRA